MTTDIQKSLEFFELFEKLASATQIVNRKPDIKGIEDILGKISAMFRLSKGVTRFYKNPAEEEQDEGETMISYDLHVESRPVHTVRFVTRLMSITTMTVYMAVDEPPLTEDELFKVDLTMRTTLAFISRNRLQDIAEQLAFYDDSGFRNIRSFFNYITWKKGSGTMDGMAAVNYNIRHFSIVNDEYGRTAGDTILKSHYDRAAEIIGDNGTLSRLGGDSFVCICKADVLEKLVAFLKESFFTIGTDIKNVRISCRAGIFVVPDGFIISSHNDIMGRIMHAYAAAKTGEHGHIIYYSDSITAAINKSKRIQQQFTESLKNGEFAVYYQPKVNTLTGEICGGEALCRWIRNGSITPPMEFIPILEETNDICRLDFHVLDTVCRDIRRWLDEGRRVVRISVNLSRRHMVNSLLLENIMEIVERNRVPHKYIEIELTETTTDVEFKDLQRVVCGLQKQDIYTSVDDFGMGYSSLNLIRVIPWNVLKVDRSFLPTDDEGADSIRSIMFRHVVAMTKEMGLECIVEGVETPSQLKKLKINSCEQAQGFLFDKPLPVKEFEKRLDSGRYNVDFF
ncbi:MAG: EAL domain-containing protein [Oribacterium sp.]|nr:EAL domain-containing protein [Oribacterium sp.]MBQ5330755.1 EAL domain-containing protein [Oscillospiraceae bacterium]